MKKSKKKLKQKEDSSNHNLNYFLSNPLLKVNNMRCCFLHFIAMHFSKEYTSFISPPCVSSSLSIRYSSKETYFDIDNYLASLPGECGHFMSELLCTEMFNRFIYERWLNEDKGMKVLLFEEFIDVDLVTGKVRFAVNSYSEAWVFLILASSTNACLLHKNLKLPLVSLIQKASLRWWSRKF